MVTEASVEQNNQAQGVAPDWADPPQKFFACLMRGRSEPDLFVLFNDDADFSLPAPEGNKIWRLAVDDAAHPAPDLYEAGQESSLEGQQRFRVESRSSAILSAHT